MAYPYAPMNTYQPAPVYGGPVNPYQQRLDQLQQYGQQFQAPQPVTSAPQQAGFIKGRPVTSEEEARGIPVDFDGSVMVFPDASHGMIYTKQLNMQDGSAIFRAYRQIDSPAPAEPSPEPAKEYAEKDEVDQLKRQVAYLQSTLENLSRVANQQRRKDVTKDDESYADDAGYDGRKPRDGRKPSHAIDADD